MRSAVTTEAARLPSKAGYEAAVFVLDRVLLIVDQMPLN
jgi:hypothetical protein